MTNTSRIIGLARHIPVLFVVAALATVLGASHGLAADGITLVKRLDAAFFASQKAPTFQWASTTFNRFRVEFSSDLTFPAGKTVSMPLKFSRAKTLALTAAAWKQIQQLEAERQIVHWRVVGQNSQAQTGFSEIRSFFISANPPLNNKLVSAVDVSFPGRGISTVVARTYLIDSSESGPLGPKWTHSHNMRLVEYSDGLVRITNRDGTDSFFRPIGGGAYENLPGDFRVLTKNGNGSFSLRGKFGAVFDFAASGRLVSITDPNDNQMVLTYNADGLLDNVSDPSGQVTNFAYNTNKQLVSVTDPIGRVVQYGYDGSGRLSSVTNAGGFQTTFSYDGANRLTGVTDANGNPTSFSYDSLGRLASRANSGGINQITFQYKSTSDTTVLTLTDALRLKTTLTLGQNGNYGSILALVNPLKNSTSFTYDSDLNLTSVRDAKGNFTNLIYDGNGNPLTTTDAQGNVTSFTYEPTFNKVSSLTDANQNSTLFDYDAQGNLLKTTYPDGSFESFTYDTFGNIATTTNRRDMTKSHTYNSIALPLTGTFQGNTVSYTYDAAGNLTSMSDLSGTTLFFYDVLNHMTAVNYPAGQSITYQYDAAGNRVAMTYPDGAVLNYAYNSANRLTSITGPVGPAVTYTYDKASRRILRTLGNGSSTVYTYDAAGNLLTLVNKKSSGQVISSFKYSYDTVGNRISMTDQQGRHFYQYDAVNQLTVDNSPTGLTSYNFDSLGNRTTVTSGGVMNYTANELNQYTLVGNTSYAYDADGNLMTKSGASGTTTYDYNVGGRLRQVTTPQEVIKYGYDLFGRRTSKSDSNGMTRFIYDGPHISAEIDDNDRTLATYVYGAEIDEVVSMKRGGQTYWYSQDGLGSVVNLTDGSQNVIESYSYDAYGMPSNVSAVGTPYRFTAREFDPETGLYYYRARYYDPEIGRFVSVDPILYKGGLNLYSYVENNPTTQRDPYGLKSFREFCEVVGEGGGRGAFQGFVGGTVTLGWLGPTLIGGPTPIVVWVGGATIGGAVCGAFWSGFWWFVKSGDPTFIQPSQKRAQKGHHEKLGLVSKGVFAKISVPYEDSIVRADVPIFGLAYGENFKEYRVEYGEGEEPKEWITMATSIIPQTKDVTAADLDDSADITIHGNLATWDTGLKNYVYLPSHPKDHPIDLKGVYTVRLVVVGRDGSTAEDRVTVEVGDVIPNAWGGTAVSKDRKVSLRVAEQSIMDTFRLISIKPAEKAPSPAQSGRQLIGTVYEFREPGEKFTKDAVLEMEFSKEMLGDIRPNRVGIYAYDSEKKTWEYLKSERSEKENKILTKVKELKSYYALMASEVTGEGSILQSEFVAKIQKGTSIFSNGHFLVKNTFEDDMGEWSNRDGDVGAHVSLDNKATFDGTRALKVTNVNGRGNFAVNVRETPFDAREYPVVQFDYRIPSGVKTNVLVKVAGRWYDIGFTDDPKELKNKRVNIANIGRIEGVVADDNWHTAKFNLYDMLRTKTGNTIVEEMIMADWDVSGYMKLQFGQNKKGATYYMDNFTVSREVYAGLKVDIVELSLDNFNQRKETNSLGGAWTPFASPNGGGLKPSFSEEDGPGRGYALKLAYDVMQPGSYAGYVRLMQKVDLRDFKILSLRVKGAAETKNLWVGLKDRAGNESKVLASKYLSKKVITKTWQRMEIPLVAFSGLKDWGGVENLSLSFEHAPSDRVGEIYIDDIAFSKTFKGFKVDDFDSEGQRNLAGGSNWTFANKSVAVSGGYEKTMLNGIYRISYGGSIGDLFSYGGWTTELRGIDCSQCGAVSFLVKGTDGGEKPNIYLDDGNFRWGVPIEKYARVNRNWQRVSIPLSEFAEYGVDLSHLAELQVVFEWEKMSGTIYIDDIRFGVSSDPGTPAGDRYAVSH